MQASIISGRIYSLAPALIFAATLSIFLLSPIHQVNDSAYSMLLSESLLHNREFALEHYTLPPGQPTWWGDYFKYGNIYQLEVAEAHVYYHLSPGSSILSLPFVAILNTFGVSAVNEDGTYNPAGETRIETIIAALLMAGLACLFFYTARMLVPMSWSIIVALGSVLGTQVWSTATRALWNDTWGIFLLGIVLLLLVAAATERRRLSPVLLATLLSWMYFVRPTFAAHIIAISVYVAIYYRALLLRYVITGAGWLVVFITYSWRLYGHLLPVYYRTSRLDFSVFWTALAGNLFSPGRGLLVFVPVLFFIIYLLARYRRHIVYPRLVVLSFAVIAGHILIVSCFAHWWGGHGFGPRFTTGLVPWFALDGMLGLQAMLAARDSRAGTRPSPADRVEIAAGACLLIASIAINGLGATQDATWLWNMRPLNIDEHPERNWDWGQPQFLARWLRPSLPALIPVIGPDPIEFSKADSTPYLWYGWSTAESQFRWTEAEEAALVFRVGEAQDLQLTIDLVPYVVPVRHPRQQIQINLNGKPVATFSFNDDERRQVSIDLPANLLRPKNSLQFWLPDAVSPSALARGEDQRMLGIAVYWMQFQPKLRSSIHASSKSISFGWCTPIRTSSL
jgi:hypothetical protein